MSKLLPALAPRPPGENVPTVEVAGSKEHSEAEWRAKKELIRKLYIEDNRKLTDIMTIMESRYGFAATEQMYKKRFKKWNIRKRLYRKTPLGSTAASPTSSPCDAEEEDIDVEELPRRESHCDALTLVLQPSEPDTYASLELVLSGVTSWSQSKIETHHVGSDPMSRYLASPNQPPMQDSRTMYRTFELVFDLWNYGRGDLAGMAARKGFYILEFVLTEDHPDLVWHILDTIYDMVDKGHLQLLELFLAHANILARRQLPANHPLLRIIHQLKKCDYQTDEGRQHVCHLLRQGWLRNVDMLGDQVDAAMPHKLWMYEQLIWDARTRLRKDTGLARKREAMMKALGQLKAEQDPNDNDPGYEQLRVEALMLEFTQMDVGDKVRAEDLALEILRHTSDTNTGEARSHARFHAYARKMLARLHADKQDWVSAEDNLRCAIRKREDAHGTNNNLRVVRDMWVLAAHFRNVGRQEDAMQVTQDAIARAQRYLEEPQS